MVRKEGTTETGQQDGLLASFFFCTHSFIGYLMFLQHIVQGTVTLNLTQMEMGQQKQPPRINSTHMLASEGHMSVHRV